MKKNKIAIVLNDYSLENNLGQYGVELAKALDLSVRLLGIEQPPVVASPSAIVGTGLKYPEALVMEDLEQIGADIEDGWANFKANVKKTIDDLEKDLG